MALQIKLVSFAIFMVTGSANAFTYVAPPNASLTFVAQDSDGIAPGYTDLPIAGTAHQSYQVHTPGYDVLMQATMKGQALITQGQAPSLETVATHGDAPNSLISLTYYAQVHGLAGSTLRYDFSGSFQDNLVYPYPTAPGALSVSTANTVQIYTDNISSDTRFSESAFDLSERAQRTLTDRLLVANSIQESVSIGAGSMDGTLQYKSFTGQVYQGNQYLANNNSTIEIKPSFFGTAGILLDQNGLGYIKITLQSSINSSGTGGTQLYEFVDPHFAIDPVSLAEQPNATFTVLQGIGNGVVAAPSVPETSTFLQIVLGLVTLGFISRRSWLTSSLEIPSLFI